MGLGAVSVEGANGATVRRIDPRARRVVATIATGGGAPAGGLAVGAGAVWVASGGRHGTLRRIDPRTNRAARRAIRLAAGPVAVATGAGAVWVASEDAGLVSRIDPRSDRVVATIAVPRPRALAVGAGAVWVIEGRHWTLQRIDPQANRVVGTRIPLESGPAGVAVGAGAVWVVNRYSYNVSRIDPATSRVATIPVVELPDAVVASATGVWVASAFDNTVTRIDPRTNRTGRPITVAPHAGRAGAWRRHALGRKRPAADGHRAHPSPRPALTGGRGRPGALPDSRAGAVEEGRLVAADPQHRLQTHLRGPAAQPRGHACDGPQPARPGALPLLDQPTGLSVACRDAGGRDPRLRSPDGTRSTGRP